MASHTTGRGYSRHACDLFTAAASDGTPRSTREQEAQLKAQRPVGCAVRLLDVVVVAGLHAERHLAEAHESADAAANRNGPLLAARRLPVRGDDRHAREIPAARKVVIDERLNQKAVRGAAIDLTGERASFGR